MKMWMYSRATPAHVKKAEGGTPGDWKKGKENTPGGKRGKKTRRRRMAKKESMTGKLNPTKKG